MSAPSPEAMSYATTFAAMTFDNEQEAIASLAKSFDSFARIQSNTMGELLAASHREVETLRTKLEAARKGVAA